MDGCHPVFLTPLLLSLDFLTHLALDMSSEQPLGGACREAALTGPSLVVGHTRVLKSQG